MCVKIKDYQQCGKNFNATDVISYGEKHVKLTQINIKQTIKALGEHQHQTLTFMYKQTTHHFLKPNITLFEQYVHYCKSPKLTIYFYTKE